MSFLAWTWKAPDTPFGDLFWSYLHPSMVDEEARASLSSVSVSVHVFYFIP